MIISGKNPIDGGNRIGEHITRCLKSTTIGFGAIYLAGISALPALAQETIETTVSKSQVTIFGISLQTLEITQFALFAGSMVAALASALWLIRERGRAANQNVELRTRVSALTSRLGQLEALSAAEGQQAVIWSGTDAKPAIVGELETGSGAPKDQNQFLAFGRWLQPRSAAKLEHAIDELREKATPFNEIVETMNGTPIEVTGRTSGASAIVRFANLSNERKTHALLTSAHSRVVETMETLQCLMDKVDAPIWIRSGTGELSWVNSAFAKAVECNDSATTIYKKAELFGTQSRRTLAETCSIEGSFSGQLSTVVGGDRLMYDVIEAKGPLGSAGIGLDRTETEAVRHELNKTIRSHEETLDQLTTAVAMFDENEKLVFHNQAFKELWKFDDAYLEQAPNVTMILDRLRTEGQLPEQPDWRRWKSELVSAFRATEPQEHWWHLTDGRTVRVIGNPHPKGGLTWVFENLTERIDLESRYTTLVRVQGETLDNLSEGVVVFASDGRLQLANPAFRKFWNLDDLGDQEHAHIADISRSIAQKGGDASAWDEFAGIVTAFDEDRTNDVGKVQSGEYSLSWMIVPLPNGQTMITFVDMTPAEQIERALRDRNDALERTANLKNRFIQHVSYELRSPLTSIMGFTDLISMEGIGPLNEKQREYIGHIESSSRALLDTTDDILDLASVDAGVIDLSFEKVDIEPAMREAASELKDRFEEHNIDLVIRIEPEIGSIVADRVRLVQVMENVLSNAADFAPEGSTVSFTCQRVDGGVDFKVRDKGPGMDAEVLKDIFEPFQTKAGGRRRGAGLGLAIVKSFVDLHDGQVTINSSAKQGTEVVLRFPELPPHVSVAAE